MKLWKRKEKQSLSEASAPPETIVGHKWVCEKCYESLSYRTDLKYEFQAWSDFHSDDGICGKCEIAIPGTKMRKKKDQLDQIYAKLAALSMPKSEKKHATFITDPRHIATMNECKTKSRQERIDECERLTKERSALKDEISQWQEKIQKERYET